MNGVLLRWVSLFIYPSILDVVIMTRADPRITQRGRYLLMLMISYPSVNLSRKSIDNGTTLDTDIANETTTALEGKVSGKEGV